MREYDFTLRFHLPDASADPEAFIAALAKAGCDDATVGVGQRGRLALAFTREARSALAAIGAAVKSVQAAIPGAQLLEAAPDFVGLSDVADLLGCTRQNLRKLMLAHPGFPAAVHEGSPAIWHLRTLLAWFADTQRYEFDPALLDVAEAAMQVNIARETRRLPGIALPKALERLFA